MFAVTDPRPAFNCSGPTRRDFLRIGTLGLGGLTLADLLAARADASSPLGKAVRDKSVVLLFLNGGPSHIETFDPKPSAPVEIRSIFGEVQTKHPGITFGSHFKKLAARADEFSIVRSYGSGNSGHTYQKVASANNPTKATMGSLYARVVGTNHPQNGIPTNVVVLPEAIKPDLKLNSNFETKALPTLTHPGDLGEAYAAFNPQGGGQLTRNMTLKIPRERFNDRRTLLTKLDQARKAADRSRLDGYRRQAFDVIAGGVSSAFDLSKEDPKVIARYDTSHLFDQAEVSRWHDMKRASNLLGKQMLLARRLCEAGCGFVTVSDCGWDHHSNNNSPKGLGGFAWLGPQVDHAVSAFMDDVRERGLENKILLVVTGEMGRTPRINKGGGRNHYGELTPLLFFGGGLKMGRVVGQSDKQAARAATTPYRPAHMMATIMHVLFDVGELRIARGIPNGVRKGHHRREADPGSAVAPCGSFRVGRSGTVRLEGIDAAPTARDNPQTGTRRDRFQPHHRYPTFSHQTWAGKPDPTTENAVNSLVRSLLGCAVAVCASTHTFAENPVGWRTDGTGRYPNAQPPKEWSPEKNIVWKTKLPGRSHCGPVVVGGKVFATAEPDVLLCVDAASGKILWQHNATLVDVFGKQKAAAIEADLAKAKEFEKQRRTLRKEIGKLRKDENTPKDKLEALQKKEKAIREQIKELTKYTGSQRGANGNTTATPVSNGRHVFASFGNGIVASYSLDGKKHWFRYVEAPKIGFGHSTSPVIADGKVIVHYNDLVALDAATGKEVWRAEVQARHGSPIVAKAGKTAVVITPGGAAVRASDGKVLHSKLFRIGHASPVVHEGVIYAFANGKVTAIKLPESADESSEWKPRWQGEGMRQRTFGSPVLAKGLLYSVTEKGILDVIDASNGQSVLRKRLTFGRGRGRVYPSPTMAGKYVYLSSDSGTTLVLEPGKAYKEIARNELEQFSGAPVFAGKRMYVRGRNHLYCIGAE